MPKKEVEIDKQLCYEMGLDQHTHNIRQVRMNRLVVNILDLKIVYCNR